MDGHKLERLMELAQRTGGTLIVTNERGDEPVILMGLAEYEHLHGLAAVDGDWGGEEFDEENYESDFEDVLPEEFAPPLESLAPAPVVTEPLETDDFAPEGLAVADDEGRIGPVVVELDEEPLAETGPAAEDEWSGIGEDEPGEEQFYLEPIE